mmetsp:Transcript_62754/g.119170  ORF Transcript_62754/g.119170 Transcript_62754/m.119170 type:complete len:453 (-) Transcript_62754:75-1433(-)
MSQRTPDEWHYSANSLMSTAYGTQVKALKQSEMSKKAHQDTHNENLAMYQDLHGSLEGKVKTSQRLIEKLDRRNKSVADSIKQSKTSLQQLQMAYHAKNAPIALCAWRMEQRQKRPLREHVRDQVEIALDHERATLIDCQRKLADAMNQTKNMIAVLESKSEELRADIDQKSQALSVDELCLRTTHRSWQSTTDRGPPSENSSANPVSPRMMMTHRTGATAIAEESNRNELRRQQDARRMNKNAVGREDAARALRENNDRLISRCAKEAKDALARSTAALEQRVSEVSQMKKRLENEVRETKQKIDHTKGTISETQSQICAIEEPIQLCSTHASWRKQRSDREQIRDPVDTRLEIQKQQLMRATEELRAHRSEEKAILTQLQNDLEQLMEDLKDKTLALNIDVSCMQRPGVADWGGGKGRRGDQTARPMKMSMGAGTMLPDIGSMMGSMTAR